jgi:hypothetical protein
VLPNLKVVAVESLPVADAIVLETYAERAGDKVGTLRRDKYLAAIASGRADDEIVRFLAAHSHADLPATVTTFFQDAAPTPASSATSVPSASSFARTLLGDPDRQRSAAARTVLAVR